MPQCKICKLYESPLGHRCPPAWVVESEGFETEHIHAMDAEQAAIDFVRDVDCCNEYTIAAGNTIEVRVRRPPDGPWTNFEIVGETTPVYYAEVIE